VADDEDLSDRTISFRPSAAIKPAGQPDAHLLLIHAANAPPRHIALNLLPITVGRSAPSELILEGSTVSRRHCKLERQGDLIVITDVGSTNGTFVNGERIEAPVALEDGARLTIGAYTLNYHRRSQQELAGWEALDRELAEAYDYVLSVLPAPLTSGAVLAEWFYQPCTRLGGDAFGYQMLDSRCFAAFMMDVAGHGAGSALFTMWYGVYDTVDRMLAYATAGHHPAFMLGADATQTVPLGTRNPSIGIAADREVMAARTPIAPGSALFLFSDGVFEITDTDGREWGLEQILSMLPVMARSGGPQRLYDTVRKAARPGPLEDDFSALALRFV
jgi:serine phosphatase RsbU (regulator of sigma subunit)